MALLRLSYPSSRVLASSGGIQRSHLASGSRKHNAARVAIIIVPVAVLLFITMPAAFANLRVPREHGSEQRQRGLPIVQSQTQSLLARTRGRRRSVSRLAEAFDEVELRQDLSGLRAREIKKELEAMGVSTDGLVEKESLIERMVQVKKDPPPPAEVEEGSACCPPAQQAEPAEAPSCCPPPQQAQPAEAPSGSGAVGASSAPAASGVDMDDIIAKCNAMRVVELRTELGTRNIPWADALEKGELVERLTAVLAEEAQYSKSGRFTPGIISSLTGAELKEELQDTSTPLLLDVYATWCGPCKMMAPHFEAAAKRLGSRVRVAKMDSDQEADMSAQLRVDGFPCIILFNRQGTEVKRETGALMEDQLVSLVESASV